MKLVSMKVSAAERTKRTEPASADQPAYPWGLSLTLDRETLEKLGLDDNLPEPGSTMRLEAKVNVTGVSENKTVSGPGYCSVTLQITALGLSAAKGDGEDTLYDKGKK